MCKTVILLTAMLVASFSSLTGQCTYVSSQGNPYSVTISLKPLEIVPAPQSPNCHAGINYVIKLEYSVVIQGNIPGGILHVLDGKLHIDGDVLKFNLPKQTGSGIVYATLINECNSRTGMPILPINATISIQGPGINNQTDVPCELLNSTLPVELISFDAAVNENTVVIDWSTATERNNDYFAIDRSTDGKVFETISKMNGLGTTSIQQAYKFVDENPIQGMSYYRLRQIDFDGTETIKGIRSVNYSSAEIINLYPNPATDGKVCMSGNYSNSDLVILSSTGKVIPQTNYFESCIDVSGFEKGIYFFQFNGKGSLNPQTIRVVVQ